MRKISFLLGSLLLLGTGPGMAATEEPGLSFTTANDLLAAVGRIKLTTARLEQTLRYCQGKFQHLAESAGHARDGWFARNKRLLTQAESVNSAVFQSVKHDASPFIAEKMALEMDAVITKSINQLTSEFADKPRKEQHYLCNRLILSIAAGERDLPQQNPVASKRLMEFKP